MALLKDALIDTLTMVPFLLVIYIVIGGLEFRWGNRMGAIVSKVGAWGPVLGAALGCVPQCGFSVVGAALYVEHLISTGTLLAIFLATSDEALPIFLSSPDHAQIVLPLIGIKLAIAIAFGLAVDLILPLIPTPARSLPRPPEETCVAVHEGCCSHKVPGGRSRIQAMLVHPLRHTLRISAFLLILGLLLNALLQSISEARAAQFLGSGTILQPFIAAAIVLIPNCFASVFLARMHMAGVLSFGSLIAGLCASAGLGLLVLLKENPDRRDTALVLALLLLGSIGSGALLQVLDVHF